MGFRSTETFGQNDGEYMDVAINYGILIVRNLLSGKTSVYSVGDAVSYLIYPSTQETTFTITRVNGSTVRVTKVGAVDIPVLKVKALVV